MQQKKHGKLWLLILTFIVIRSSALLAQDTEKDTNKVNNTILPVLFYLPETGFAFGGTGITTFRLRGESQSSRASQFVYSAAYTLKNQLLIFLPFELYRKENRHRLKGELGFYKYFYNYYGLGGESRAEDLENYDVLFPRINVDFSSSIIREWQGFYLGSGIRFDHFDITKIKEGGLLDTQQPIGYEGGTKLNLALLTFLDKRDNVFSTYEGYYLELIVQRSLDFLWSDFKYWKYDLDARYFKQSKK